MKKTEIKPGVVYAYRQPVSGELVPLVFLSAYDWIGSLYRVARYGDRAFVLASGTDRPQAGNVGNNGSIGYPAVRWMGQHVDGRDLARLRAVRFDNFRTASTTVVPSLAAAEFLVVTSTARVIGPWEDVTTQGAVGA